jgi:hypothetical protein
MKNYELHERRTINIRVTREIRDKKTDSAKHLMNNQFIMNQLLITDHY